MIIKKVIALSALFVLFNMNSKAQFYVGGSLSYTSTKLSNSGNDQSGSSFKIMPEIGYCLNEKVSLGVQAGYAHGYAAFGSLTATDIQPAINIIASGYADISEETMKLNSFTIMPYIRYNVLDLGKFHFFLEGATGYTNIKSDGIIAIGEQPKQEFNLDAFEIAVRPGITLDLSKHVNVLMKLGSLGFISAKDKESDMKITRSGFEMTSENILIGLILRL